MIRSRTLFVVGAGASAEANIPAGDGLKVDIARRSQLYFEDGYKQTRGDRQITDALRAHVNLNAGQSRGDINPYLHAAWHIARAMPLAPSIDHFINSHQGNERIELCGKLAIVSSILEAEKGSHLYFDPAPPDANINFENIPENWYSGLMQMLVNGRHVSKIEDFFENTSFIVFNYDRCIEHFFYNALQNYYGIDPDTAAQLVNDLTIIHPYGVVGKLQWQDGEDRASYGGRINAQTLLNISQNIRTFTEQFHDKTEMATIKNLVDSSEVIVFLGFAFHEQNMKLIWPSKNNAIEKVFATTFGISSSDCKVVKEQINSFAFSNVKKEKNIEFADIKCNPLLQEYWRSLSN